MVSDWFEKDNFKQTVRQLLIDALKEIKVDFYGLDPVVQASLLDEGSASRCSTFIAAAHEDQGCDGRGKRRRELSKADRH